MLLSAIGILVFSATPANVLSGGFLYGTLSLIVCDLILEVLDIYVEKKSRQNLGGISSSEMVLHVFASSFRMAAIVMLLIVSNARGFSEMVSLSGLSVSLVSFVVSLGSAAPQIAAKTGSVKTRKRSLVVYSIGVSSSLQ